MPAGSVLITGADGYLGRRVAERLLRTSDAKLALWVHANNSEALRAKQERFAGLERGFSGRLTLCGGDLADADPFASVDRATISAIIHSAAVTRFNVDAATADAVNVAGTEKALQWAGRCSGLQSFTFLSSVYASGLAVGPVEETVIGNRPAFANHYERSKWESENLLTERFASLPWRMVRIATAIADNESGQVTQLNAVHNTLKLFYYGLLSLVPGVPKAPLYLVTGDFAAEAVCRAAQAGENRGIYHVSPNEAQAITLGDFIDRAFAVFMQQPDFSQRRVLKPLFSDLESFDLLAGETQAFSGGVVAQAVGSIAPFARQLFVMKRVGNERLRALMGTGGQWNLPELTDQTCRYLARTRWGKITDGTAVRAGA